MTETVVAGDTDAITDIQDYLQSFNKEIGESNGQNTVTTSMASANSNVITDTIYTIDGEKITGNIVLTDQVSEHGTFMVMNDQQYMLIMSNDDDQSNANEQAMVVTDESNATTSQITETQTPKRSGRGLFRSKQRIKEEIFDDDSRHDISVYDFNELNIPNRNNSSVNTTLDTPDKSQTSIDDDPEFKTPLASKTRTRSTRSAIDSPKKSKSNSGSMTLNTSTNSSGNVHVCTYCSYTSTKRYLLSRHLKSHSEDRPHKCGICERGFKTLASLQNHVNTHTGVRPHQCKFCEAAFTTSGELVRHIRYRHTHEKPHRCTECDYASVELSKLKRHMRCHTGERPYQCPHCTYASPDTYKLKRHLRIHTGEKPYVCDVCNQRFTQSNSLKAHKLIHTGNKPIFKCEFCPTTCGRKTDLRIHVQKLHTSDKMLTCKRCDQSFPDRYQFKLHLKTHEGEKCFKCDLCSYASVSARHLESHMLIHTDQKPFICDVCHVSFRQKQLLKRHKNLYHNPNYVPPTPKEKTHECSQCTKAFRHKGNLIRHMSLHDPDAKNQNSKDFDPMSNSQLIDDEIYEDEDDIDTMEDVSLLTDDGEDILNSSSNVTGEGTISITIDNATHQLISSNNELMLVVQVPNSESGEATTVATENGQPTMVQVSTPRIISRSGRVTRSTTNKANEVQSFFEAVTNEDDKQAVLSVSENAGDSVITIQQAPQLSFDNNDTINLEEQLQKQKDLEACFGFKDEDDEDDIILSMSAVHGQ